jgi:hypothetical protein
MVNFFIFGFFLGTLVGGWYSSYFIKIMKKRGYVNFDVTDKFMDEFKQN